MVIKEFFVNGAKVSVTETKKNLDVLITGKSVEHERGVRAYLIEEGIFEALCQGPAGLNFDKTEAETYLKPR